MQIICISILIANNHYQQTSFIHSAKNWTGYILKQKNKLTGYFSLRQLNDDLLEENRQLKTQLGFSCNKNPLKDTQYNATINIDSITKKVFYQYEAANVINATVHQKINYITIDKGSMAGIQKNMGVISNKGIVGKIIKVSEHYAVAACIISDKFSVSAKTMAGNVGKISWDNKNIEQVKLSGIPQSAKLKKGDTILTSGYSYFFPENIHVGYVVSTVGANAYTLKLATDFTNLHYVYIIKRNSNTEQKAIEDSLYTTF